ncbi:MAG: HAD family hydrolase [Candidatus Hodarchaeota archaeon]
MPLISLNEEDYSLFLDDGGVMNDNFTRGEQWKDLIAEYFVPRYGGKPDKWREANHQVVGLLVKKVEQFIHNGINQNHTKFQAVEDEIMINFMFDAVGIERPPKQEYGRICREVEAWVIPQVQADIEGIVNVIKELRSEGYTLHTASGETSWVLREYLTGMGILDCFTNLYGPDIVDVMKGGLEFYRRIFIHAQIDPTHAIVIDDNPKLLQIAGQLGAHTIQSCVLKESIPNNKYYFTDPAELPEMIRSILPI